MATGIVGFAIRSSILASTAVLVVTNAIARVVISAEPTQNMSCSGGVCAPTAAKAVLNADDLENLLATGNVEVTTTGSGVQAKDIEVKTQVGWSNTSAVALDAWNSIAVDQPVSVAGAAALSLTTGDGGRKGRLSFGKKGSIGFANLSSSLTINGAAYTLVGSIQSLAAAIANNPSGSYALAASYDASQDGTYASSPIPTTFTGNLEGLGNAFENLTIDDPTESPTVGFFTTLGAGGSISDLGLTHLSLTATEATEYVFGYVGGFAAYSYGTFRGDFESGRITTSWTYVGGFAAENQGSIEFVHSDAGIKAENSSAGGIVAFEESGSISDSYTTGNISSTNDYSGGLVGENGGPITRSHATGNIRGNTAGGLVGLNLAEITDCYATGSVRAPEGVVGGLVGGNFEGYGVISRSYATGPVSASDNSYAGGLVGNNNPNTIIENSYSTGAVAVGSNGAAGGFAGYNDGTMEYSYSTGAPSAGTGSYLGGYVGEDVSASGSLLADYWDTDLSGITNLSQGAGNIANDPGITGLTTEQFQAGLPTGFDPKIWTENANIDDGLPYLIANPPPS